MTLEELLAEIRLPEAQLYELLETAGPDRFVLLETGGQAGITRSVVATTRARVCRRKYCQKPCDSLHLCKLNLLGRCHYAQSQRNLCKYSHEVLSEQNFQVLKNHELSGLNQEELACLLVQSDPFFLPEICKSYKGEGRKQICGQPQPCERLHICEHFTRGNCSYLNCLRSHNLMDRKVLTIMREHGLNPDVVQNIQDICNSKHARRNPPAMRAAHPHRRGGAHRDRSKSRDRFLHNSLEFLSPVVSPLGSGPPSPDVTSSKDSLEDVSVDVTQKFKYLGTHDRAQLSSVSSKAAGIRRPSQMRASQEFSEDKDLDGIFSRNRSDSSSSRASAADAAQRNEAMAMKMGVPSSGHRMEVKGKKEAPDINQVPFLNRYIDGVTMEEASVSGILGKEFTANDLEKLQLLNDPWKSVAKPQDLQTTGRITDSGQDKAFLPSKYGGNPAWASTSTHNAPNGASRIMDETPNVSKSSTTGFAVKSAVAGEKEAVYSGVQSQRSQVLAMPGETTTPVQSNRLPQSPLSSSSHRAAASGSPGKNSTHASASPASESSRMTSDSDEYLLRYLLNPVFPKMGNHDPKEICQDHLYKGCQQIHCDRSHFHLPYRWQMLVFTTWRDFQDMESIEQAYCDPQIEIILIENHQINFRKMMCDSYPIRRLSTPSSVEKPLSSSVFTTKWIWYWKNEFNEYIQYGNEVSTISL